MEMKKVTTHEAKTHLSRLLTRVLAGEQILICRGDVPIARLVPATPPRHRKLRPSVGTVTSGPIHYTPDAFRPMTGEELDEWGL